MGLTRVAIMRPLFILMVVLAMVLMGLVSYTRLGVDLFPNVNSPVATVITTYQPLQEMDNRLKSRVTNESHSEVVAITAPSFPGKTRKRRAGAPRRLL